MYRTSNGTNYTDSYGNITLPHLCDYEGNNYEWYGPESPNDNIGKCMVCDSKTTLSQIKLPCIIRDNCRKIFGKYNTDYGEEVRRALEAFTYFEILLCNECEKRANALMITSDHAVKAKDDYWDIIDEFTQILTDPSWERFSYKKVQQKLIQKVAKKMTILENASKDCPQTEESPFTLVPHDILILLSHELLCAEKKALENDSATIIQTTFKKWLSTYAYLPKNNWRNKRNMKYCEAIKQNIWMECQDCKTKRQVKDLVPSNACAEYNCCKKYVCRSVCYYNCPLCDKTSIVKNSEKYNDGEDTEYQCSCGHKYILYEEWSGQSIAEFEARHEERQ